MNDEVKAAAERRRKYLFGDHDVYRGKSHQIDQDCFALADAYLALCDDDSKPIEYAEYKLGSDFKLEASSSGCDISCENNPNSYYGCSHSLYLNHITTRGQLRTLCRALRIELKEPNE